MLLPYKLQIKIENGQYDEDELALLGNSKAWKLLKSISVLDPDSNSKFSPMFFESCYNYVKKGYKSFTTMQLKRAIDFFDKVQYYKNFEAQKAEGSEHPMTLGIKEFKEFYTQKMASQQANKLGINLQMSNEETTLDPEEQKQDDNVFEKDLSEEEEQLQNEMKRNPKLRDKVNYKKYQNSNLITNAVKNFDFSQFSNENIPNTKIKEEYKDTRINKIIDMVDESYKKISKQKQK